MHLLWNVSIKKCCAKSAPGMQRRYKLIPQWLNARCNQEIFQKLFWRFCYYHNKASFFNLNYIFLCAPFGCLYFSYFSVMNQNWVQESILAWLWHHYHLALDRGTHDLLIWAECSTAGPQLLLIHAKFLHEIFHFWCVLPWSIRWWAKNTA